MSLIRPIVPVMEYAINYDYIKKVLCVNKYEPQKKCNGKCHLKKELDEVFNDKDTKRNSAKNNTIEETVSFFCQKIEECNFQPDTKAIINKLVSVYKNSYSYSFSAIFFHPPCHLS